MKHHYTVSAQLNPKYKGSHEDENCSPCMKAVNVFLIFITEIVLFGTLGLVIVWVMIYRGGFAWQDDYQKEFNLHPVLMIGGFIFFVGQSILVYRTASCCKRIFVKLLHTILHLMAVPCVAIGFIAALDSHNLRDPPVPNFYSLHSWMGFVTMGLFALQFIVGFISFLILLCCESATAAYRECLVPIHSTFGIVMFMMAVATCVTGLTEKAFFTLSKYRELPEEAWVVNALGISLVAVLMLMVVIIGRRQKSHTHGHALVATVDDI